MKNRINFFIIVACLLSSFLLAHIYKMQHISYHKYSAMALKNSTIEKPIIANRGIIFDRNNEILADNTPIINIYITPDVCDNIEKALEFINSFSILTPIEIKKFYQQLKQKHNFDTITVKQDISAEDASLIYGHIPAMPCVSIHESTKRKYYHTPAISNILGYIGANGAESTFNDLLTGINGAYIYKADASRHPIELIKKLEPTKGYDIKLSIDAKLQSYAYDLFSEENGAAVVINAKNGDILAMVSHPMFDSNKFLTTISNKDFSEILNNPNLPLLDRATKGRFAPGSTIKPFIAISALQAGFINQNFAIHDYDGYFIPKGTHHIYRDWLRTNGGHGLVDIEKSLAYSCDVFYYKLSMLVGMKKILPWLANFGFGQNLVSEIPYANTGILSSPKWKQKHIKQTWYTGDTVMSYIGQGYMLTTPLQLATALAILVNSGKLIQPHLLDSVLSNKLSLKATSKQSIRMNIESKNLNIIKNGMESVIRDKSLWATGWRFGKPNYSVAGKTGTAQVVHDNRKTKQKNWHKSLRDNHWFMAFSPVSDPEIVLVVLTEHSNDASKIARKILDYIKQRQHIT